MFRFMKELWVDGDRVEFLLLSILFLGLVACFALLIYMADITARGCPVCGCHEWLQGEAHYYFIGGIMHKTYEHICENCGYIF